VRPPSIRGPAFGTTTGSDLTIAVVGEDLDTMHRLGREISARLEGIPGLEGVEVGREDQSPLMRVRVDRDRAADLGLRVSDVGAPSATPWTAPCPHVI
jgi:Cu/Ag efflux pump CusA